MRMRRGGAALLAVFVAGCGAQVLEAPAADRLPVTSITAVDPPTPSEPPAPQVELDGLQDALNSLSEAFAAADPDAVRPWLHDPRSLFGRRWLDRAANLSEVPLSHYALELDPSLPDLATDRLRSSYDDPVVLVYVVEEHALEGFDVEGPASEDLFLTAVRTDEGWRIAADTDAEPLGLVSVDHLWDHGPVVATRRGPLLGLHHPETGGLDEVLAETELALDELRGRWPLAWSERVPIIVPRDQDELAELLHVTFDLTNFVAFATATPTGDLGEYQLTGARIVLNTPQFLDRGRTLRQRILVHELTHVASRPFSGPFVPSWLEEGMAQALGERRSTTGTVLLDGLVSRGFDGELPTDGQFVVGSRDRIFLSYQLAWSFVDHLADRFGEEQVARFYASAGEGAVGEPGTEAWHVDRAAREVFGLTLDELRDSWREALSG